MAADIKFRLLADDDIDITGNSATPHQLTPYVLYRGMAVYQEYHEIYAKNEGTNELVNPTHMMLQSGYPGNHGATTNRKHRKVTGSAKDSGSTATIYIDYGEENEPGCTWAVSGYILGPTAIPDDDNEMAVGRCYDLWTKYACYASATSLGAWTFRHTIGGSEPE